MKKTLLLAIAALTAAEMSAQKGDETALEKFQPGTIAEYDWRSSNWNPQVTTSLTYDSDGNVLTETNKYQKTEYTYDSNGMVVSQTVYNIEDNGTYTPARKVEYTYDTIVTDFKTSVTSYNWRDSAWQISDSSRQVITRNDQGYIVKIENQDMENSKYVTADEYCTIEYGTDGTAQTITCYEEDYEGSEQIWNVVMQLTDIVWDRTDGQITDIYDSNDLSDFYQGANRIKSATIAKGDYPGEASLSVRYDGEYGYDSQISYAGAVVDSEKFTSLDSYGSYTLEAYYTDFEYDEDKGQWDNDGSYSYQETRKYDKFGLLLEDTEEDLDSTGKVTSADYERGEVTYDTESGMPTEYIVQKKNSSTDEYTNDEKYVYSDYGASVDKISYESTDETEYYDLNGIRINATESTHGIMIRRHGNETVKMIH